MTGKLYEHQTLSDSMKTYLRLFAASLWLVAGLALADSPRLLVLGDSLSAGYGLDRPEQGWVPLLAESLAKNYQVINASVSGETAGGALARLPALLRQHKPARVIVELGGNDGLRGHSLALLEQQLTQIIRQCLTAGADVLLMEMRIPPNYGRRYTEKFTALYRRLADQTGITLVPFFLQDLALQDGMMQNDGIHPTDKAQPLMRDSVLAVLQAGSR